MKKSKKNIKITAATKSESSAVKKVGHANSRTRTFLIIAAILLLTIAVYSNSINNGFSNYDDDKNVYENIHIRNINSSNVAYWITKPLLGMYTPTVYLSYAIDYQIAGLNPWIYHLTNLVLHLTNITLVFFLIRLFTGRPAVAAFVALLFAVHPMNVAAVTPVSLRSSLLYTAFYLVAFYSYICYVRTGLRSKYLVVTFLLFILSAVSKSVAVIFPMIMLLVDWYYGRKFNYRTIMEKVPFFVISVVLGVLTIVLRDEAGHIMKTADYTFIQRICLISYSLIFYPVKLLLPINLSVYYPYPELTDGMLHIEYYIAPFAVIGTLCGLYMIRQYRKELFFGALFFLLNIVLALRIVPIEGEFVCDRYVYVPCLGLFMVLCGMQPMMTRFPELMKKSLIALGVGAVLFLAVVSHNRNALWHDYVKFYDDILGNYPKVAVAYNNRGLAKMDQKDYKGAIEDLNKAISLKPDYFPAFINRGMLKMESGDYNGAMRDFDSSINIVPYSISAYNKRGMLKMKMHDYSGAAADFDRAISIQPKDAGSYNNRGNLRVIEKEYEYAISDYETAIYLEPNNAEAYNNRGNVKLIRGDAEGAMGDFSRAIEINSSYAGAYYNRANLRKAQRDNKGALADFNRAIELEKNYSEAYNNRGVIKMEQQDYAGAIADYDKAEVLMPKEASVYLNRGIAKILSGRKSEACADWHDGYRLGDAGSDKLARKYCK